jgi:hypothetical protein
MLATPARSTPPWIHQTTTRLDQKVLRLAARLPSTESSCVRSTLYGTVRFSGHFERFRRHRSDRADITIEMCERVKAEPMKTVNQDKGRKAYQGDIPEKGTTSR